MLWVVIIIQPGEREKLQLQTHTATSHTAVFFCQAALPALQQHAFRALGAASVPVWKFVVRPAADVPPRRRAFG